MKHLLARVRCRLQGHLPSENFSAFAPGELRQLMACPRCLRVVDDKTRRGQYPLPR